ncbi:MAG: apolipoprotein N-acyltransferase, partial [Spirochaetales bacterium]|nr:apolipoprotein N-acyltransferase [Spirochaetales bacterium]
ILASLEPFTRGTLTYDVPVYSERTTLFTRLGQWFELLIFAASLAVIFFFIRKIIRERKENND